MNFTKTIVVSMVALSVTLLVVLLGWSRSTQPAPQEPATEALQTQPIQNADHFDLRNPPQSGQLQVAIVSNGRNRLVVTIRNDRPKPASFRIRPGLIFERLDGEGSPVALVEGGYLNVKARATEPFYLQIVALNSSNADQPSPYHYVAREIETLKPIFHQVTRLPAYSRGAIQTAVLAVRENLPLSAFARFPLMSGDPLTAIDTDAFRVSVADIISALQLLKDSGLTMDQLAITVDPQLVVEAMVDPMARMAAMKFYGIDQKHEWLFWREMLNNGPQALRHYALHGIARFYPEIALDMHPRWIRSENVNAVMRSAAISGLAETGHPDALPIFAQLAYEFRENPGVTNQLSAAELYLERAMEARLHAMQHQLVAFRYEPLQPRALHPEESGDTFRQ